jgi:hypothetical protein
VSDSEKPEAIETSEQLLRRMKRDYYGNGKIGDRVKTTLMWRGVGALLFMAGYGLHGVMDQLIAAFRGK